MRSIFLLMLLCAVCLCEGWIRTSDGIWNSGLTRDCESKEYCLDHLTGEGLAVLWRVSSEPDYDFFEIEADGVILLRAGGVDRSWQFFSGLFPGAGEEHRLVFRFCRDGSGSGGKNCAEFFGLRVGDCRCGTACGDWRYRIAGGCAVLTGYAGAGGAVQVPANLGGRPVFGMEGAVFGSGSAVVRSLLFENGIVFLGDGVFRGVDGIEELTLPASLSFIGRECFRSCRNLRRVISRSSFLFCQEGCWMNCVKLQSVVFPGLREAVPGRAFWGCGSLEELSLPEGVQFLGPSVFAGSSLRQLSLPMSCRELDDRAMVNCACLQKIQVPAGHLFFSSEEGILFDAAKGVLVLYPCARRNQSWMMPHSVRAVRPYALYGAEQLEELEMSPGIEELPGHALQNCSSLSALRLPDSLRVIRRESLAGCSALTHLMLPSSLLQIEDMAFWGCSALKQLEFDGFCPVLPENLGCGDCSYLVWRGAGWEQCPEPLYSRLVFRGYEPVRLLAGDRSGIFIGQQKMVEFFIPDYPLDIYYSMDGSAPDSQTGLLYRGAFPVNRTCLLRYRGYLGGRPMTVEQTTEFITAANLPVECGEAFLISECGDSECCIEKYLGDRQAFRIPEKIDSLFCRGIAAGAFQGSPDIRLVDFPDSLLWLELRGMPELAGMTAASRNIEIIGNEKREKLWFREEYPGKIFLERGWNICSFPESISLADNPPAAAMHPAVLRKQVYCHGMERIQENEGVWIWSPADQILPYVPENRRPETEMKASGNWNLGFGNSGAGQMFYIWEKQGWRQGITHSDQQKILGWRRQ